MIHLAPHTITTMQLLPWGYYGQVFHINIILNIPHDNSCIYHGSASIFVDNPAVMTMIGVQTTC
jgi:hypothetical protein